MSDQTNSKGDFLSVSELHEKIKNGENLSLVDVREASEYEGTRIQGAIFAPLSKFAESSKMIDKNHPSYIICQSGKRASQFANKLREQGQGNLFVVEGGLNAWLDAGYPIEKGESRIWSLERQVRFVAGLLVLLGIVLSLVFSLKFLIVSGFVGAGLVFAAITDTCGMAIALARMPWNQKCKAVSKKRKH